MENLECASSVLILIIMSEENRKIITKTTSTIDFPEKTMDFLNLGTVLFNCRRVIPSKYRLLFKTLYTSRKWRISEQPFQAELLYSTKKINRYVICIDR